jgi:hypothetical protein
MEKINLPKYIIFFQILGHCDFWIILSCVVAGPDGILNIVILFSIATH